MRVVKLYSSEFAIIHGRDITTSSFKFG